MTRFRLLLAVIVIVFLPGCLSMYTGEKETTSPIRLDSRLVGETPRILFDTDLTVTIGADIAETPELTVANGYVTVPIKEFRDTVQNAVARTLKPNFSQVLVGSSQGSGGLELVLARADVQSPDGIISFRGTLFYDKTPVADIQGTTAKPSFPPVGCSPIGYVNCVKSKVARPLAEHGVREMCGLIAAQVARSAKMTGVAFQGDSAAGAAVDAPPVKMSFTVVDLPLQGLAMAKPVRLTGSPTPAGRMDILAVSAHDGGSRLTYFVQSELRVFRKLAEVEFPGQCYAFAAGRYAIKQGWQVAFRTHEPAAVGLTWLVPSEDGKVAFSEPLLFELPQDVQWDIVDDAISMELDGEGPDAVVFGERSSGKIQLCQFETEKAGRGDSINTAYALLRKEVSAGNVMFVNYLAAADINGDGVQDLMLTASGHDTVLLYLSDGSRSISGTVKFFSLNTHPAGGGVSVGAPQVDSADLDGDGDGDFVVALGHASGIAVLLDEGAGTYRELSIPLPGGIHGIRVLDLNCDGTLDIAAFARGGKEIALHTLDTRALLGGKGMYSTALISTGVETTRHFHMDDIDGDGRADGIVTDYISDKAIVFFQK